MLAHLIPVASMDTRMRGILDARFNCGPSPVPGWGTVTAPVACGGRLAAAVSLTARTRWIARYRGPAVTEVVRTAASLGDKLPAARPFAGGGVRSLMRRGR